MIEVCGVLVHARPERVADVQKVLETMDGVEVHTVTDQGRLVITLENTDENSRLAEGLAEVNRIDGVLAASLVYEHSEAEQTDSEQTEQPETVQ